MIGHYYKYADDLQFSLVVCLLVCGTLRFSSSQQIVYKARYHEKSVDRRLVPAYLWGSDGDRSPVDMCTDMVVRVVKIQYIYIWYILHYCSINIFCTIAWKLWRFR